MFEGWGLSSDSLRLYTSDTVVKSYRVRRLEVRTGKVSSIVQSKDLESLNFTRVQIHNKNEIMRLSIIDLGLLNLSFSKNI